MVSGAKRGIRLDVVTGELTELCPCVEEPWPTSDDPSDRIAITLRRGQGVECVLRFGVEHGLGRAAAGEVHGSGFGHCPATYRSVLFRAVAYVLSALDADTAEKVVIGFVIVLVVGIVLVIRSALKLASKIVLVLVIGGLGVALFQNRVELGRCSQTCSCSIYGHDVEVPHLPFSCNY